jgi:3-deoxy-D-manno-octulosonate 8-phosphate phosphatase (KDO 8-P phosphatase)
VTLPERARRIKLLLLDVDGVLTDGSINYTDNGIELKRFHVRDGSGLKLWALAGKRAAIISGRTSEAVSVRAMELGVAPVVQGQSDKTAAWAKVLAEVGVDASEVAAIGDDLPDLPLLNAAGIGIAVADACAEVREAAAYTTTLPGGRGAVREAIEWLLKLTGEWDGLVARYRPPG